MYFIHYSHLVMTLFSTCVYKFEFSAYYFCLSVFSFCVFLYIWFLDFLFCFEFNVKEKDLIMSLINHARFSFVPFCSKFIQEICQNIRIVLWKNILFIKLVSFIKKNLELSQSKITYENLRSKIYKTFILELWH